MSFSVLLAGDRGMCAGVHRAISTVEKALERYRGTEVYVLHEVVHNRHVVAALKEQGAVFVEDLKEVPDGSVLIFSAHGVGKDIEREAAARQLTVIDATCPVVSGIHRKMNKAASAGLEAVVIGHKGHQEVIGTIGQYTGDPALVHVLLTPQEVDELALDGERAIFATQTTLSVEETALTVRRLRERYPHIKGPKADDTCTATQRRQNAVRALAQRCEVVLIVGSANSSNSNRLREVAQREGARSYLVDDAAEVEAGWLEGATQVGVSAGASVPEYLVSELLTYLKERGATQVQELSSPDPDREFPLPGGL
ncbi:MAG: 4-hydroxy-3-methylbut-2-enyl diphosphate reductase [Succinivibrio sp.]|nr:4-hydroxy-3-methylbut-2-enyl diphosphate reductase [Succinivibrio sp.]